MIAMPPPSSAKRPRDACADESKVQPAQKKTKTKGAPPRKSTLFDDLDAGSPHHPADNSWDLLKELNGGDDDKTSLSSLSELDPDQLSTKTRASNTAECPKNQDECHSGDDDEDLEFEDVHNIPESQPAGLPEDLEHISLTLVRDTRISLTNAFSEKKGPTKKERAVRVACHKLHVLFLLWHNAIRNSWLCDPEVQATLLSHVTPRLWEDIERWRRNSGLSVEGEHLKSNPGGKGKERSKNVGNEPAGRSQRAWGSAAQRLEEGAVNMAQGDPLFRLMKVLAMFWKQRFRITSPGLRKIGYMSLERLDRLTKAYAANPNNPDTFGERICSLEEFRQCARNCAGSRDVGAQLFTALLRALGLEARMTASLQALGFGWTKAEEAEPEREPEDNLNGQDSEESDYQEEASKPSRKTRSAKWTSIDDDGLANDAHDTDDPVINVSSLSMPKRKTGPKTIYHEQLEYPHYWTEVLSPVTKKYLPVDPLIKFVVATNRDLIESLEPRGAKADKAKQVIAYVVGYSQDGSAKDVTLRYLKSQMMPGRTKGMRMPPEKIPVYNRQGKIKRHDLFDWFKFVMKGYERSGSNIEFPITDVDMLEDSTDLKPRQPEKREPKEGQETLQYYKNSEKFVLERHLKREEALLATAEPVRLFVAKGKQGEKSEENVYLRKDVVPVKSAETWHKQGRAPVAGEEPLKRVPYRAATINRKLAIQEAEAATGEKVLQGLFSFEQTDWIIPPPIKNGKIPKNEYGNIDLFVEHMLPQGATHVPYRGAMRVCKKLGIDFAEAVVDFDFGHRMAAPVIQGIVIAEEYHDQVMEELARDEAERARKEDEKRRKKVLDMWRRFLMGMRVAERLRRDYGDVDGLEVFRNHTAAHHEPPSPDTEVVCMGDGKVGEDLPGGFLLDGFDYDDDDDDDDDDDEKEEEEEEKEKEKEKEEPGPSSRQSKFFFDATDGEGGGCESDDSDTGLVIEDGGQSFRTKRDNDEEQGPMEERPKPSPSSPPSPPIRAPPARRQRGGRATASSSSYSRRRLRRVVAEVSLDSDSEGSWGDNSGDDSDEYVD